MQALLLECVCEKQIKIKEKYLDLYKENNMFFGDWLEDRLENEEIKKLGFRLFTPQRLTNKGKIVCFVHNSMISETGYIKGQTIDHFATVMRLAGLLVVAGFQNVKVNHHSFVDISAELDGESYGFEYEHDKSHDKREIRGKKERWSKKCQHLIFICSNQSALKMIDSVGRDLVLVRGNEVKRWLDNIIMSRTITDKTDLNYWL
jgi:hypothetical protein